MPSVANLPSSLNVEQGYSNNGGSWMGGYPFDLSEPTPELQWPYSIQVYDRMRRQDAQVAAVLRAVSLPVMGAPWRVHPDGADPVVVKFVSDNLGIPILGQEDNPPTPTRYRDTFSWSEHVRLALLSLAYGHMGFEKVYEIRESGEFGQQAFLVKLAPRLPTSISKILVDRFGNLTGIASWQSRHPA